MLSAPFALAREIYTGNISRVFEQGHLSSAFSITKAKAMVFEHAFQAYVHFEYFIFPHVGCRDDIFC